MGRTFKKLLKLIAPDGMSHEEYVVRCAVNNVSASPDDLTFVRWLLETSAHEVDDGRYSEAEDILCELIEKGRLLDFRNLSCENDFAIADVVVDAVMWPNKRFKENFFAAVLHSAPHMSKTWKAAYRLNRALGFTSVCYFKDAEGNPSDGICV